MSNPANNQPEPNLSPAEPEVAADELPIGSEPLDELLAESKIFADYVAALASEK